MFHELDHFLFLWDLEARNTMKLLKDIPDAALSQEVAAGHRDIRKLSWHLVISFSEMMGRADLPLGGPDYSSAIPGSSHDIREAFREISTKLVESLKANWQADTLQEEKEIYGRTMKKGFVLYILLAHLIHHRGQMTVLMRQAGLAVPGLYGPSLNEWESMGMKSPDEFMGKAV